MRRSSTSYATPQNGPSVRAPRTEEKSRLEFDSPELDSYKSLNPARILVSQFVFDKISSTATGAILSTYTDRAGGPWAVVRPESIRDVAWVLKFDPELDFRLFLSIDAVDRLMLPESEPRFEIVYFFRSLLRNEWIRLKVRVPEDQPELPTIATVYQGANWWERFVWDFYGIRFVGHPDLRRILMYEEFKGHPLRKDYPLRERQPLVPERPLKDIYRGPGTSSIF